LRSKTAMRGQADDPLDLKTTNSFTNSDP